MIIISYFLYKTIWGCIVLRVVAEGVPLSNPNSALNLTTGFIIIVNPDLLISFQCINLTLKYTLCEFPYSK